MTCIVNSFFGLGTLQLQNPGFMDEILCTPPVVLKQILMLIITSSPVRAAMTMKLAGPCDVRHRCRCDLHCYGSLDHLLNQVVAHATPSLPRSTTNHIQDVHTRTTSPGYTAAAGALKDSLCTRAQRLSSGKQGRSPAQLAAMHWVSQARGHGSVLPGYRGTRRKERR